jgi:hypothetical protein
MAAQARFEIINPSTKKGGADAYVPAQSKHQYPNDLKGPQLDKALEKSMAETDRVSVS